MDTADDTSYWALYFSLLLCSLQLCFELSNLQTWLGFNLLRLVDNNIPLDKYELPDYDIFEYNIEMLLSDYYWNSPLFEYHHCNLFEIESKQKVEIK